MNDLAKSMEYSSRAVELTPDNHPHLPQRLANLGVDYGNRFQRTGDMNDLAKSMEYSSRAVELTPDNHPHLPQRLASLGVGYSERFKRTGDMNDLAKSMEYCLSMEYKSRAVELTPDNHPHLPQRLANLGVDYGDRFQRTGDMNDLAKSMEYFSCGRADPRQSPRPTATACQPGSGYSDRFKRTGDMNDLAKPTATACSLGVDYSDRFKRTGDMNDLAKSMEYKSRVDYGDRFQRTGDMNDLAKSMEYKSRAVELTPDNHPHLPQRLASLGVDYGSIPAHGRHERPRKVNDTRLVRRADPDNHPDLPQRLASLGVGYSERFKRTGDMNDLAKSMEYSSRAVALTSEDHPDLSRHYFNLSMSYFTHYHYTSHSSSLSSAMLSLRTAARLPVGPPRETFMYALEWAQRGAEYSTGDCMEAYRTAVNLLPHFIWLGAPTDQQYQDLLKAEDLAVNAASTAILSSSFDVALEWLEHARCVVWSQSLALRSPLDRLHKSHPDIATQLHTISNTLYQTDTESSHLIRTLDGFEDFLLPMKSVRLIDAARSGPVIVINCSERCCDALVIIPGQAQEARDKMEASLWNKNLRERGVRLIPVPGYKDGFASVLLDLWTDIVKPVLDFLGYMESVQESGSDLPHVTWCPTGVLSFLPLHALATTVSLDAECSTMSYRHTPTLTALLASTPSTLSSASSDDSRVLDAMDEHDWVHLACHAHQNVINATKSGFFLHDGTLDLAAINRRSFRNKGLAFLSACQTATGDHKLPDEAIHLASGMLMAGYPSVIATRWSVKDADAPFIADRVYAELMKEGKVGNGEAGRALHSAVAALREKVGEKEFGRWACYIHIGS
ncbi:TPR-like protein [Rhizoctonia solani]|uniref:TPR-like protein n=1 Tax=Rhizoctonia solani TaxID=456999 RepID=A0A8H7I889_9AGAM|nr:TPR-like protein [Rhizoctonia solani]